MLYSNRAAENQTKQRSITQLLLWNLLKLVAAGTIIGLFHKQDLIVAGIFLAYLVYILVKQFEKNSSEKWIYLIGVIITSILGIICENWGVRNDYWSYHNLDNNREFPYWLPIAWGLAFTFIYKIEKEIINIKNIEAMSSKLLLALCVAVVFPTIGEIVVINLGAWSYHWPLQVLGVPLLAMFLLLVFHTGVNFLLMAICKKLKINNVVFSNK